MSLEADNVLNELVTLKEDVEQTEQTRCELITISCNWREAIRNELRGKMASLQERMKDQSKLKMCRITGLHMPIIFLTINP